MAKGRLGRPFIQELAVHLAYWKYAVLRQLADQPKGGFFLKGSNGFPRDGTDATQWKTGLALLDRMHKNLRTATSTLASTGLDRPSAKAKYRLRDLILGAAARYLHHGG